MNFRENGSPGQMPAALSSQQYQLQLQKLNQDLFESSNRVKKALGAWLEDKARSVSEGIKVTPLTYSPLIKLKATFSLAEAETWLLLFCFQLDIDKSVRDWWQEKTGSSILTSEQYSAVLNYLSHGSVKNNTDNNFPVKIPLLPEQTGVFHFQLLQQTTSGQGHKNIEISSWAKAWLGLNFQPGRTLEYWISRVPNSDNSDMQERLQLLLKYWQQVMQTPKQNCEIACFVTDNIRVSDLEDLAAMAGKAYGVPVWQINLGLLSAANANELRDFYQKLSRGLIAFQSVCLVDLSSVADNQVLERLLLLLEPCFKNHTAHFILLHTSSQQSRLQGIGTDLTGEQSASTAIKGIQVNASASSNKWDQKLNEVQQ